MMTKYQLLRKQKRFQKFLKSYHVIITLTAFMLLAFTNIQPGMNVENEFSNTRGIASEQRAEFFKGFSKNFRKPKQIIEVRSSYEKLSQDHQVRITGMISSGVFTDGEVHYEWSLVDNVVLISGNTSGNVDLAAPEDFNIDVLSRDPSKPIRLRLQASAVYNGSKYGNTKEIVLNTEDLTEMDLQKAAQKINAQQSMSKEESLRLQMETTPQVVPRQ